MPDHLGALVLLCAWCALRVGEVLELRRRDLDLNRGVVKVDPGGVLGPRPTDRRHPEVGRRHP